MAARVPLTNRLPIWLTAPGPRTFRPSPLGKATTALVYLSTSWNGIATWRPRRSSALTPTFQLTTAGVMEARPTATPLATSHGADLSPER